MQKTSVEFSWWTNWNLCWCFFLHSTAWYFNFSQQATCFGSVFCLSLFYNLVMSFVIKIMQSFGLKHIPVYFQLPNSFFFCLLTPRETQLKAREHSNVFLSSFPSLLVCAGSSSWDAGLTNHMQGERHVKYGRACERFEEGGFI